MRQIIYLIVALLVGSFLALSLAAFFNTSIATFCILAVTFASIFGVAANKLAEYVSLLSLQETNAASRSSAYVSTYIYAVGGLASSIVFLAFVAFLSALPQNYAD